MFEEYLSQCGAYIDLEVDHNVQTEIVANASQWSYKMRSQGIHRYCELL